MKSYNIVILVTLAAKNTLYEKKYGSLHGFNGYAKYDNR